MVKMINIISLIGFFLSNEDRLKQSFKNYNDLKIKNKKINDKIEIKKMRM